MIRNFFEACDYENGYSKAIQDIKNFFNKHSVSLKYNKLFNSKDILSLLSFLEKERDAFMKYGEDLEVSFKRNGKQIEFYLTDKSI